MNQRLLHLCGFLSTDWNFFFLLDDEPPSDGPGFLFLVQHLIEATPEWQTTLEGKNPLIQKLRTFTPGSRFFPKEEPSKFILACDLLYPLREVLWPCDWITWACQSYSTLRGNLMIIRNDYSLAPFYRERIDDLISIIMEDKREME